MLMFAHDHLVAATALLPLLVLFDFAGGLLRGLAAVGVLRPSGKVLIVVYQVHIQEKEWGKHPPSNGDRC